MSYSEHVPVFRRPRSPEEAQNTFNPNERTHVINIDGLPVLFASGIPLATDSNLLLYADTAQHKLDLVDADLITTALYSPIDKRENALGYLAYKKEGGQKYGHNISLKKYTQAKLHELHSATYKIGDTFGTLANLLNVTRTVTQNDNLLGRKSVSKQYEELDLLLNGIFQLLDHFNKKARARDMKIFHEFLDNIKSQSEKPFLIINGHGGTMIGENEDIWLIGEQLYYGIAIDSLLKYLFMIKGENHYSAILLFVCNPDKLAPRKFDNTPIYFVEGDAGFDVYRRKTVKV